MKKRLIAMILCCAVIAGAGCANAPVSSDKIQPEAGNTESLEPEKQEASESGGQEENGISEPEEQEASEISESEKTENAEAEQTASDGEEETTMPQFDKVVMNSSYDKAAYFLDTTYKSNPQNTLVSPLSLDMALGLVSGGAQGKTKEELSDYLSKEDYGQFASEYMQYTEQLNRDHKDDFVGGYRTVFEIANSVWVNDNRELISEYEKKAKKDFQAKIAPVSFDSNHKSETAKKINGWCDEKTHGLIPSIISEDVIEEALAMILINSLYFEAPWRETWDLTQDKFTDLDGNETEQEMLRDTLSVYYENDKATAFSKYYMNGLEFIGILPKQTGDFEVGELDIESLLKNSNTDADVYAMMPKLDFETTAGQIVPMLKSQGVETPFDKVQADFGGLVRMRPDENTYISAILQKCKIELDENGTKAAAVTAVMLERLAAAPVEKETKEIYLDRPFAFMIYDRENDQIVFIGKVVSIA